jgi:uncharacterized protein YutE (UPF0331/DUF86 family)
MSPGKPDHAILRRHLLALDTSLQRLLRHAGVPLEAYLGDGDLQWLVERGLLVCTQNVLDIATHVAASLGHDASDYTSSIDALADLQVLPPDFAKKLRPLAGFRNVLVHAYLTLLTLDPRRVHEVLTSRLADLATFAEHVERYLSARSA